MSEINYLLHLVNTGVCGEFIIGTIQLINPYWSSDEPWVASRVVTAFYPVVRMLSSLRFNASQINNNIIVETIQTDFLSFWNHQSMRFFSLLYGC